MYNYYLGLSIYMQYIFAFFKEYTYLNIDTMFMERKREYLSIIWWWF